MENILMLLQLNSWTISLNIICRFISTDAKLVLNTLIVKMDGMNMCRLEIVAVAMFSMMGNTHTRWNPKAVWNVSDNLKTTSRVNWKQRFEWLFFKHNNNSHSGRRNLKLTWNREEKLKEKILRFCSRNTSNNSWRLKSGYWNSGIIKLKHLNLQNLEFPYAMPSYFHYVHWSLAKLENITIWIWRLSCLCIRFLSILYAKLK